MHSVRTTQNKQPAPVNNAGPACKAALEQLLPYLANMQKLMVQLMFTSGLSSSEVCKLRLRDLDFKRKQLWLGDATRPQQTLALPMTGKAAVIPEATDGASRAVPICDDLLETLKIQVLHIRSLHRADRRIGLGKVELAVKSTPSHIMAQRNLAWDSEWQFVFPRSLVSNNAAASRLRAQHYTCADLNNDMAKAARLGKVARASRALTKAGQRNRSNSLYAIAPVAGKRQSPARQVSMSDAQNRPLKSLQKTARSARVYQLHANQLELFQAVDLG